MTKIKPVENKTIQNPDLKKAMDEVKAGAATDKQEEMYRLLTTARFLAPISLEGMAKNAQGKTFMSPNARIRFLMLNTNNGKQFLPVFTDMEEAAKMTSKPAGTQFAVRSLKDYKQMMTEEAKVADGIVVNPMSHNIILPRRLAEQLAEGRVPKVVAQRAAQLVPASYSEPQVYPTAMVNAVYERCREIPEVSRVWLKQMNTPEGSCYALFVEAAGGSQALNDQICKTAEQASKGKAVKVLAYSEDYAAKVLKDSVPLYNKDLDI